jgi:sugar phosphate isomerase/epimerase
LVTFRLSAFADEYDPSLDRQLAGLQRHGIGCLEIRGVDGKSVSELTDGEAREAARKLAERGIALSAVGSPYGKYPVEADFAPHREAFRRGLDIADRLGAKQIRVFSFYLPEPCPDPSVWRGKAIDQLGEMVELAEAAGLCLCHENEKGIYGSTAARCRELLRALPKLGCVYDPANFIQCDEDAWQAFAALEDDVDYMHVKDALRADGSVVPAGKGDGQVRRILARLAKREGVLTLTLEPHLAIFDGLSGLQKEELTRRVAYPDAATAFAAAADALKEQLRALGYDGGSDGIWRCEEKPLR